ncbi:MAG: YdeI/OmpD-associated family protein [Bacteroidota bacterium]
MLKTENFEQVPVASADDLRAWLEVHHGQPDSVWIVTFKKHVGAAYVSREAVLNELLCFGWVDGIRRKLDADRTMQLASPRQAQHWAKSYKDRAARLIAEGRMRPPGLAAIEASKASGLWTFMDDVDALVKPDDLEAALATHSEAARHFDGFPASSQRFVLRWIKLAKKPETRRKRIERVAALAARGERLPGS